MGKVSVKLKHPTGRFEDQGKQLQPYEVYSLEGTEKVLKAIEIGLLEKVPMKKDSEPAIEEPKDSLAQDANKAGDGLSPAKKI